MRHEASMPRRGWQNRALERERDAQRILRLWRMLLAMAIALSPAALYLVQNNLYVKTAYEASETRERIEVLEKLERDLLVRKESLEAEARVEAWARRQRDLQRPPEGDVYVVEFADESPADLVARVPETVGDARGVH